MGIVEFVLERAKNKVVEQGKGIGMEIERSKNKQGFVESLLTESDFTTEKIARTVVFV